MIAQKTYDEERKELYEMLGRTEYSICLSKLDNLNIDNITRAKNAILRLIDVFHFKEFLD
jgi:hypothetical protein